MKVIRILIAAIALALVFSASAPNAKIQQPWPDLDVLDNYPNDLGDTCALHGKAAADSEKGKSNALKNRYRLPGSGFETLLISKLFEIPSGTSSSPPTTDHPNQKRAVTVVGYVRDVKPGGRNGESCNCGATRRDLVDTHIDIVLNPNNTDEKGHGLVVAEITERIRRLARLGLLQSNIGDDWSLNNLKARLEGRWVKFSGYLYYDDSHHKESWRVDPSNNIGNANWRETSWEIHPVMAIETNVLPPPDAERISGRPNPRPDDDDDRDDGDNPNWSGRPIIGNRNSRVYHLPGCPGYTAVGRNNRVEFRSESAAQQAGYRRAGNCQ